MQSRTNFPASWLLSLPMSPDSKAWPPNFPAVAFLHRSPSFFLLYEHAGLIPAPECLQLLNSPYLHMVISFSKVRFQHLCLLLRAASLTTLWRFPEFTFFIQFTDLEDYLFVYSLQKNKNSLWQLPLFLFKFPFLFLSSFSCPWTLTNQQTAQFRKTVFKRNVLTVLGFFLHGFTTITLSKRPNNKNSIQPYQLQEL